MNSPFIMSHEDRVMWARRRYFEEGILPTGIVSDSIFQSWTRCHRANQRPQEKIEFQPVSASRSHLALQKNWKLHEAWQCELPSLWSALGSANCSAILTDASGVLIGATPASQHDQKIISIAHRVGVNLSEEHVGTTAPGIVARTGKQACVLGGEHYYDSVKSMYCTAAPIRNIHGQLAGILDISSEGSPFKFDPSAVVGLYAASIENRLLAAQSNEHLVVYFQFVPTILDTPMVGMLGLDHTGKLVWVNSIASNLLGIQHAQEHRPSLWVEDIFDINFSNLASLAGAGLKTLRLRSGLQIYMRCDFYLNGRAHLEISSPMHCDSEHGDIALGQTIPTESIASPSINAEALIEKAASLKQADADLIQKVLKECKGNVSQVAKLLKVSRGLIYRRMTALGIDPKDFKT